MAISQDTTTNFTSAVGYTIIETTPGDVVFSSGTASLSAGVKRAAIRTPTINASTWQFLQRISSTCTQDADFEIKFLVSFSDWTNNDRKFYESFIGRDYRRVLSDSSSDSDIIDVVNDSGMGLAEFEAIRLWPSGLVDISVLVGLDRTDAAGSGNIDLITYFYGDEEKTISDEGTASGTLPIEPEWPISYTYLQAFAPIPFYENYLQNCEKGGTLRRRYSGLNWVLNTADSVTVDSFLDDHLETPFNWQAQGDPSSRTWIVEGRTDLQEVSADVWRVSATFLETK